MPVANLNLPTSHRLLPGLALSLAASLAAAQDPAAVNALAGSGSISAAEPHRYADVLVEGDIVSAAFTLAPQAADVGKRASVYVAARITEGAAVRWFSLAGGKWQPWDGDLASLPAFTRKLLQPQEQLQLVNQQALFPGDYEIFAGYRVEGGALVYSQNPLRFAVAATDSDALQRFSSPEAMEAYLKEGLQQASTRESWRRNVAMMPTALDTAATAAAGSTASRTSATNLQESGVDEADIVKVAGSHLFMLAGCGEYPCVKVERLDSAGATATPVSTWTFDSKLAPDGMYRVPDGILGQDMLVTVAGQFGGGWYEIWGGWQNSKTELNFLNIADPARISRSEKLTFDGALVSSRVVGGTLYLVTRYTPAPPDYIAYPVERVQEERNAAVLERADLPQILPQVRDSRNEAATLVQSRDCYLPVSAVDGGRNPSIITITAVPLKNPTAHRSTCFLGASETLYMSTQSLYLATTSWDYEVAAAGMLRYTPNHTTAIHKFALDAGNIVYRGSGTVRGHLGWHEDKKSFRMGENGAYLNVASSIGDSWGGTSSTRLTVLKEAGGNRLETVSVIDGIGKPGEQLYAARFLGRRAYLVTFRVVDPLYVVDLSNQESPRIAGELEIEGYSDYLHPISDTLLLGIGKDAIPADAGSDFGRGAWYQGVKLSLFDVANPAQPREIDSLVLGRRGTESDVLWDHHALSYLPALGSEPARVAIPVRLHDRTPTWQRFDATAPSAWYDYTHTALYSFEVNAQGISQAGRIVADVAPTSTSPGGGSVRPAAGDTASSLPAGSTFVPAYFQFADRSVLKDDAVFYLHDGRVLGSLWGENRNP